MGKGKLDEVAEGARDSLTKMGDDVGEALEKSAKGVAKKIRKDMDERRRLDGEMGPGDWKSVNRNHKYLQQKLGGEYEKQVTGRDDGKEYAVKGTKGNEVKFDGFVDGKLIETKHGYSAMVNDLGNLNGAQRKAWFEQAQRQVDAAGDTPIEWVFSNEKSMNAARRLFMKNGWDISVRHQPFDPPPSSWDGWKAPEIPK
ncbi:MAG: Tox-REase-5 domain-containing protein [Nocardioides sp.]|uniref:Tox-REase-5 domain-containing protein n=1 Tax=Nocardioides sp. TaxID=35761 RepID=UPI003D6AF51B